MISTLYNSILAQPLLNTLVFLANIVPFHDLGISIVILTIIVRLVIFPFTHRSIKTQVKMKELEPEIRKIKEKFKNRQQEQAKEVMALYKKHGVSPFSGCLILLIQLPILIALYRLFWGGVNLDPEQLYSFVQLPEIIQTKFLGLIDVNERNVFLAIFTGVSQFFQMRLAMPPVKKNQPKPQKSGKPSFKDELARSMSFQSRYILPGFILLITLRLPAAVAIYWTTMNLFAIIHEGIVRRKAKKIYGSANSNKNNKTNN